MVTMGIQTWQLSWGSPALAPPKRPIDVTLGCVPCISDRLLAIVHAACTGSQHVDSTQCVEVFHYAVDFNFCSKMPREHFRSSIRLSSWCSYFMWQNKHGKGSMQVLSKRATILESYRGIHPWTTCLRFVCDSCHLSCIPVHLQQIGMIPFYYEEQLIWQVIRFIGMIYVNVYFSNYFTKENVTE